MSPDLRIATVHQGHRLIPFLGVGDDLRFAAVFLLPPTLLVVVPRWHAER
nr:hypothetical protein [Mobilicoccus pelagius]